MTDATPPSIPPRKRATAPVTGGTATSTQDGAAAARNGAPRTVRSKPTPPSSGQDSGVTRVVGRAADPGTGSVSLPPSVAPGARPSSPSSADASVRGSGARADEPRPKDEATVAAGQDASDAPSPLVAAVDTATGWIKKAAGATGAAVSAVTRPRPEDPPMTTTPAPAATTPRTAGDNPPVARPGAARPAPVVGSGAPRRVRLAISRLDPWSVMKLSFLLSVAIGIMIVVATAVVWLTLDGLHVFTTLDDFITQVTGTEGGPDILEYVEFQRVISGAIVVAVVDVFLITALSTLGAFLYNIVAALVGGVRVTMTDE